MTTSWGSVDLWTRSVDDHYKNVVARRTHLLDEYKEIRKKIPIDVNNIELKKIILSINAAVLRAKSGNIKDSDGFLGYLYCEKIGIESSYLVEVTQSNDLLLTYLIASFLTEDGRLYYQSINRIDRRGRKITDRLIKEDR